VRLYNKLDITYLVGSRGICMRLTALIIDLKFFEVGYCNNLSFVSVTFHKGKSLAFILSSLLTVYSTTFNQYYNIM